jgi:hypothetical protein
MLSTGKDMRARARGPRLIGQILLAVQILSLGHLLSVSHVTCLEHGDVIHVQYAGAPTGTGESDRTAPLDQSIVVAEPGAAIDHDHCLVCVDANRRGIVGGQSQVSFDCVPVVEGVYVARTAFAAPVDLILLSPKNSPPSA